MLTNELLWESRKQFKLMNTLLTMPQNIYQSVLQTNDMSEKIFLPATFAAIAFLYSELLKQHCLHNDCVVCSISILPHIADSMFVSLLLKYYDIHPKSKAKPCIHLVHMNCDILVALCIQWCRRFCFDLLWSFNAKGNIFMMVQFSCRF